MFKSECIPKLKLQTIEGFNQFCNLLNLKKPQAIDKILMIRSDVIHSKDISKIPISLEKKAHSEINILDGIDEEDLFLKKIYFQKISYIIKDNHVEQTDDEYFNPKNLLESVSSFETGQVYSVLIKEGNNFMCLGRNKKVNFADRVLSTDWQ